MEPYLSWNGIEIANATRTMTYINNGLGPSGLASPGQGCLCTALLFGGAYVSPSADTAPWYDSAKSESAQFLGFLPLTLDLVPSMARTTGPAGIYGSSMGRIALAGQIVRASGWLVAATQAGQEFGERWLLAALRSQTAEGCAGCDLGTATILPACPDGSAATFRTLYRCGIADYTPAARVDDSTPWNYFRLVSFQLRSELPWMFAAPTTLVATTTTFPAVSANTTTGTWPGEAGIKMTLLTGTSGNVGGFTFTGTVVSGQGSAYSAAIGTLPPSHTLVIDGATRDVSLFNASGVRVGGIDALSLTAPFSWPEMVAQSTMTWRVALASGGVKNANTSVKIERYDREF